MVAAAACSLSATVSLIVSSVEAPLHCVLKLLSDPCESARSVSSVVYCFHPFDRPQMTLIRRIHADNRIRLTDRLFLEPIDEPFHAGFNTRLRVVAEQTPRLGYVRVGNRHVARLLRLMIDARAHA